MVLNLVFYRLHQNHLRLARHFVRQMFLVLDVLGNSALPRLRSISQHNYFLRQTFPKFARVRDGETVIIPNIAGLWYSHSWASVTVVKVGFALAKTSPARVSRIALDVPESPAYCIKLSQLAAWAALPNNNCNEFNGPL